MSLGDRKSRSDICNDSVMQGKTDFSKERNFKDWKKLP